MSDTLEFLQSVLPSQGWYCLAKPYPNGGYGHQTFATVEELVEAAEFHSKSETDIFFTVGSLKERETFDDEGKKHVRTHANMAYHKALFVDLDCGTTKEYKTQVGALNALKSFCKDSGWFKPTYANSSGKGIHAYWVFNKEVTTQDWHQLAERFKVITRHFGLKADPVCTSDKARVLRVPGTFNWKNPDDPKPVKVLLKGDTYPVSEIQAKIKSILADHSIDFKKRKEELPEHLKRLFAEHKSNLQSISEVNIEPIYASCQQMARVRDVGGPVGYGMRSCAASIIKLTREQDYSVLSANDANPDLVESQTENMIVNSVTDNPSTCERFESFNEGGCDGCQYQGKIKSPIVLGKRTLDASNPDDVKTYQERLAVEKVDSAAPNAMRSQSNTANEDSEANVANEATIVAENETPSIGKHLLKFGTDTVMAYQPPKGIRFAANGYIVKEEITDDGPVTVTIADFIILPLRTYRAYASDMVEIWAKVGINDPQKFQVELHHLASADSFRKILAGKSIFAPGGEKSNSVYNYMISYIKHLQTVVKSTDSEMALGWSDDNYNRFVTPTAIITPDEIKPVVMDERISAAVEPLRTKGTFEEWKSVIDFYAQDGYEDYAFGHLTAYGSLVFPFSGHSGAIISMIGQSGSGKSTILKSINSVYGKSDNFLTQNGTGNAQMNRLSVMRNYCVTYDEITNIAADKMSDLAYAVSQGKAKMRLDQNSQERDTSKSNWQLIMACTGNANLSDRLSSHKIDASAETLRIFEYYIHRRDTVKHSEAREIFEKKLDHNYGHAGNMFIEYMVQNVGKIHKLYDDVLVKLEREAGTGQKERFWLAVATSNIVGGIIAKKLNLHSFDMQKIFEWAVDKLREMQGVVVENTRSPAQVISEFINNSANKALVMHGGIQDKSGKITAMYPTIEPSDQLWIRVESDRGLAFIDRQRLKEHLTKGGSDYNHIKGLLLESGVLASADTNKVLSQGSNKAKSGSTKCWVVRLNHKEMEDVVIKPVASDNVVRLEGTQAA